MSLEDPGAVSFAGIGGLGDQVRELREVIELPLMNPELFEVSSPTLVSRDRKLTISEWESSRPRESCYMVLLELVSYPFLCDSYQADIQVKRSWLEQWPPRSTQISLKSSPQL